MAKQPVTKYRPVLPAHLITHAIELAKKNLIAGGADASASAGLIAVLAPFQAKIDNAGIVPAYETKPRQSLEESLGMEAAYTAPVYVLDGREFITKEYYWEACYIKVQNFPEKCTLAQIQAANEYRYLNGLMSPEEMVEFEREAFTK